MSRYNYLLPKHERMRRCQHGGEHYYLPISVQATIGNYGVKFWCKRCAESTVAFLTEEEFSIQQNLIESVIQKNENKTFASNK